MLTEWSIKRVLITVRTYPTPARRGVEVSCTAGIAVNGEWVRLYPIPYRSLDEDQKFVKYQWVEVSVIKARNDTRPESYTPNLDSIKTFNVMPTTDNWRERRALLQPLIRPSLCAIQNERDRNKFPTLGLFKPRRIDRFVIESADSSWSSVQLEKLNQTLSLFGTTPQAQLGKIPFSFKYEFHCDDNACPGHTLSCTDWELAQSYRRWRHEYRANWQDALRQKYETEMINRFDTYFFVGNLHQYPNAWIIVGLFYPLKPAMGDLFDR
jgi:hypothetical protein